MDHAETVERDFASRYLRRELSDEEERQFEEHIVDCARCLDELDALEGLRHGLRAAAAGTVVRSGSSGARVAAVDQRPAAWWRRPAAWATLAATVAVAVTIPLAVSLARQRDSWRSAAVNQARLADEARQAAAALSARVDRAEQALRAVAPSSNPSTAAVPVFALSVARDAQTPASRFSIPGSASLVVLTVDLDGGDAARFRATLTSAGAPVWSADGLIPSSPNDLGLAIPADVVPDGEYVLRLERVDSSGRATTVGRYRFGVTRSR